MASRDYILKLSLKFLIDSIDKRGGSRAYYSKIFNPIKGWSLMYPETSGYIIPTLLDANSILKQNIYYEKAKQIADWLLSIQHEDGSFPGLLYHKKNNTKSIFNSAQILIGLVNIYDRTQNKKYLNSIQKCSYWIVKNQNDNGSWLNFAYKNNFMPSYYTRVSWPLLLTWKVTNDDKILNAAKKSLELIYKRKLRNGFVKNSGFERGSFAFIHTIAYVIRGFYESGVLLDNSRYENLAISWAKTLLKKFEINGKLPGAFYENYEGINNFECLTGYSQLAIIWMKIFINNNDPIFLNSALKANDKVSKRIPNNDLILKSGGVPGSYPFYGKYMTMRQPNWATKFFIDAIFLEKKCLQIVENKFQL